MSAFEEAKEFMMLLITFVVLVFVTIFFFIVFGNYKAGGSIDVRNREAELVSMRIVKCLEGDIDLNKCVKQYKYGAKVFYKNKVLFVNKELYERLFSEYERLYVWHPPESFKQWWRGESEFNYYVRFGYRDPLKSFVEKGSVGEFSKTEVSLLFKIKKDE